MIEPLLSNSFLLQLVLPIDLGLLGGNGNLRVILHVRVDHKGSKGIIHFLVDLILDDREDVKTREDGLGEIDIISEVQGIVVVAFQGVGSSNNGAASLEGGHNTCLGDVDALLLHGLVNGGTILVIHLVELID